MQRKLSRKKIAGIWCLLNSNDANAKRNREDDYKGTSCERYGQSGTNSMSTNACDAAYSGMQTYLHIFVQHLDFSFTLY